MPPLLLAPATCPIQLPTHTTFFAPENILHESEILSNLTPLSHSTISDMNSLGPLHDSPPIEPPIKPTGASRQVIDAAAAKIATKFGFTPGADLRVFIENKLGGKVVVAEPEERLEFGYLRVPGRTDSKFDIVLSPYTGEFHDRFTMAHELGHYFLHYLFQNRNDSLVIKREGTNRAESEANWFAEGFLMPAEEFEKELAESEGYLPSMVYRFRVASDLISHRARTLKSLRHSSGEESAPDHPLETETSPEPDGVCNKA